ncbi:MAG: hypothetical protein ACJKSS_00340 [Patescibacteria group bacterium UBA2103]
MTVVALESDDSLREKVQKGIRWLNENEETPTDWKYRLFSSDGEFRFLGQLCIAETSILPLIFKDDLGDEVIPSDVGICAHFEMSHEFRVNHGFFVNVSDERLIQRLNKIWELELRAEIEKDAGDGSLW